MSSMEARTGLKGPCAVPALTETTWGPSTRQTVPAHPCGEGVEAVAMGLGPPDTRRQLGGGRPGRGWASSSSGTFARCAC